MDNRFLKFKGWIRLASALCVPVVLYVFLSQFSSICGVMKRFSDYFSPVLLGTVIAYLVSPLAGLYRKTLLRWMKPGKHKEVLSNLMAFLSVFLVLALMLVFLIPQLVDGVTVFMRNLNVYIGKLSNELPEIRLFGVTLETERFLSSREKIIGTLAEMLNNNIHTVLETSATAGRSLFQWMLALFLSIYLLAEKEKLKSGACRLLRALLPERHFETVIVFFQRCNLITNRYVVYNLLDSLVIGGANLMFMAIMRIPYAGLVSFVCGVTNLIPTAGPMIGAAVGALILFMSGIRHTIIFLVFTAVLQFVDGYYLKPKLFGSSLGVSSLWILVGIIVGGRMLGITGVLLSIPAVAILDFLYEENILPRLEARRVQKSADSSGTYPAAHDRLEGESRKI